VERSGGAPVLLPLTADTTVIEAAMSALHGLLLSGGGDIVSLEFGEEPHPENTFQDPTRDRMEIEATRIALRRGIPILGICRGIQLLNVALGGTLVQHIPDEFRNAVLHRARARDVTLVHSIEIEPGSLLARVLGATRTAVNSFHHQAVKRLGKGLRVNCRAPDGVIEGVESDDGRPMLAVQCHPEDCCVRYPLFQKIFDWLVEEARKNL